MTTNTPRLILTLDQQHQLLAELIGAPSSEDKTLHQQIIQIGEDGQIEVTASLVQLLAEIAAHTSNPEWQELLKRATTCIVFNATEGEADHGKDGKENKA